MDIEKLKVVVEYLREHLEDASLDMTNWIVEDDKISACGTAGCLAWHAVRVLTPEYEPNRNPLFALECRPIALRLLGMTGAECAALFFYSAWPREYPYSADYTLFRDPILQEEERERRIENMRTLIRLLDEVIERGEVWWIR